MKTKQDSLRRKIEEILASDCRTPHGCLLDHDEAIDQIIELFKSELPEKRECRPTSAEIYLAGQEWNACLDEIKKKLK